MRGLRSGDGCSRGPAQLGVLGAAGRCVHQVTRGRPTHGGRPADDDDADLIVLTKVSWVGALSDEGGDDGIEVVGHGAIVAPACSAGPLHPAAATRSASAIVVGARSVLSELLRDLRPQEPVPAARCGEGRSEHAFRNPPRHRAGVHAEPPGHLARTDQRLVAHDRDARRSPQVKCRVSDLRPVYRLCPVYPLCVAAWRWVATVLGEGPAVDSPAHLVNGPLNGQYQRTACRAVAMAVPAPAGGVRCPDCAKVAGPGAVERAAVRAPRR